jgi:hypothetical protein
LLDATSPTPERENHSSSSSLFFFSHLSFSFIVYSSYLFYLFSYHSHLAHFLSSGTRNLSSSDAVLPRGLSGLMSSNLTHKESFSAFFSFHQRDLCVVKEDVPAHRDTCLVPGAPSLQHRLPIWWQPKGISTESERREVSGLENRRKGSGFFCAVITSFLYFFVIFHNFL